LTLSWPWSLLVLAPRSPSFYDDMMWVLHDPPPSEASFVLVLKRWCC
jgi:hypothetical protein